MFYHNSLKGTQKLPLKRGSLKLLLVTGPSHIILALASSVALSRVTGYVPDPVDLLLLSVGALLPDIDGNGSITRPGTILKKLLGKTLSQLVNVLVAPIALSIKLLFGHRGITHSLIVPAIFFALGIILNTKHWLTFGYLTHIFGDLLTPKGVPLLSPLINRNFSLKVFRTGSSVEVVVTICLLFYLVFFGIELLPENTKIAIDSFIGRTNN